MKISHRLLVLTLIMVLSLGSIAAGKAPKKPVARKPVAGYTGLWSGTAADGSRNDLRITLGRKAYTVDYVDFAAAECGGGRARGRGSAQVVGNTLSSSFAVRCESTGAVVNNSYSLSLTFNGNSTVAWDATGVAFNKIRSANCR